jgi:hypothetical protein
MGKRVGKDTQVLRDRQSKKQAERSAARSHVDKYATKKEEKR